MLFEHLKTKNIYKYYIPPGQMGKTNIYYDNILTFKNDNIYDTARLLVTHVRVAQQVAVQTIWY